MKRRLKCGIGEQPRGEGQRGRMMMQENAGTITERQGIIENENLKDMTIKQDPILRPQVKNGGRRWRWRKQLQRRRRRER